MTVICGTPAVLWDDGGSVTNRPRDDWKPVRVLAVRPRASSALQPYLPYPNSCQGTSPHQQGRGTKVSEPYYVGIDVSIDRLDVAIRPGGRGFCVTNDAAGWAELVARLPQGAIAAIGLEPSGGFSIAADVKLQSDDLMPSLFCALADDVTRGSRFSSRSASGRLMME